MRGANPAIVPGLGVGLFSFGEDKHRAGGGRVLHQRDQRDARRRGGVVIRLHRPGGEVPHRVLGAGRGQAAARAEAACDPRRAGDRGGLRGRQSHCTAVRRRGRIQPPRPTRPTRSARSPRRPSRVRRRGRRSTEATRQTGLQNVRWAHPQGDDRPGGRSARARRHLPVVGHGRITSSTCSTQIWPRRCLIIDLVVGRGGLTDVAWERIAPLLPGVDGRGRPWRDHRQVTNGGVVAVADWWPVA
ncbi:Putative transposase of IS4/5 family [Streptomyces sp. 2131.1]|nr:Putative transposase of IS4/5 family [Streptomyces sp. 2131.1]